jgi:hypothetical protein
MIRLTEKLNDLIGNRTHDLPAGSSALTNYTSACTFFNNTAVPVCGSPRRRYFKGPTSYEHLSPYSEYVPLSNILQSILHYTTSVTMYWSFKFLFDSQISLHYHYNSKTLRSCTMSAEVIFYFSLNRYCNRSQ